MGALASSLLFIFSLFFLFSLCQTSSPPVHLTFGKVHVYVKNDLEPEKILTVHCKSKDDDLGEHELTFGSSFTWKFRNNFWATTLFWCNLAWYDAAGNVVSGSFNIYDDVRDHNRCTDICSWSVKEIGLYSYNSNSLIWENLYSWPTNN